MKMIIKLFSKVFLANLAALLWIPTTPVLFGYASYRGLMRGDWDPMMTLFVVYPKAIYETIDVFMSD